MPEKTLFKIPMAAFGEFSFPRSLRFSGAIHSCPRFRCIRLQQTNKVAIPQRKVRIMNPQTPNPHQHQQGGNPEWSVPVPPLPAPIPSANGKPYFPSGGWIEVLANLTLAVGAISFILGLVGLADGALGSGMLTMNGLAVIVLGGILATIYRIGSMLESAFTQRRH